MRWQVGRQLLPASQPSQTALIFAAGSASSWNWPLEGGRPRDELRSVPQTVAAGMKKVSHCCPQLPGQLECMPSVGI